jgi:FO synthase
VITYCRVRPADSVSESWARARRRQGTTTVEIRSAAPRNITAALGAGLLPVALGLADDSVAAWVVDGPSALALAEAGIPGWRITVLHEEDDAELHGALQRSRARYLRTGRSRVDEAAAVAGLAGAKAVVSVFVDGIGDALAAVEAGAGDLLLRGWDTESLGELREALRGRRLVERGALPPGLGYAEARHGLPEAVFAAYLNQVDGSGVVRPRVGWAAGRGEVPPVRGRLSAEWGDEKWVEGRARAVRPQLTAILERSLAGERPGRADIEMLFGSRGSEVEAVADVANQLRARRVGVTATYVVNRNINYTNRCIYHCGFCAFSQASRSAAGRAARYLLSADEVARRAQEAWAGGATEVCLQGGIHPRFTGDYYVSLVESVKAAAPGIHVHGFSPHEVWRGAQTSGTSVADFLTRLKEAGLGSLPGTAAEILDDEVRAELCPDKISATQWCEIVSTAHDLGIPSTATIMFGHIDSPRAWARHLDLVGQIQERTGGFTEMVPLPFVHMQAPIYRRGRSRPGPTWDEVVLVHAVSRIALDGLVDNVQASWAKLGLDGASLLLRAGCNDLGGTLTEENISRAAGAVHGEAMTPGRLEAAIRGAGLVPARRNTLYEVLASAD